MAKILLGYPYADIAMTTGVAVSTIKKIKARNKDRYQADQNEVTNYSVDYAKVIMNRAYGLLMRRLNEEGDKMSISQLLRISNLANRWAARGEKAATPKPFAQQQNGLDQLLALLDKK